MRRKLFRLLGIAWIILLVSVPVGTRAAGEIYTWMPLVANGGQTANPNPVITGIATYYDATGAGACSFGPSPDDLMVAALDTKNYAGSSMCGAYLKVTGPKGTVSVRIVDWCPDCQADHIDLSREAFALIADPAAGRVAVTWQLFSPALVGPIAYHFKDGSNQWWTAVQIRNHRSPVAKLEYQDGGGQWVVVPRLNYNYFVEASGLGPGPYSFRVTDSYGNVLVDSGILHVENGTVNGGSQFP